MTTITVPFDLLTIYVLTKVKSLTSLKATMQIHTQMPILEKPEK